VSSLSGAVAPGGQIGGSFAFETFANGAPFGAGSGTFSGTADGATLSLQLSGSVPGGCQFTGSLAAIR
jgi:hypothetical protein